MLTVYVLIVLMPLFGAIAAGLFGKKIGRRAAHWITILGVGASFLLSLVVFNRHVLGGEPDFNGALYTWAMMEGVRLEVGFLVDSLTAMMITVVTFVSLMVHVYTIGYMEEDDGYQRFFSYISLFTFSMLMLVMSNNFLQLFFGWEAVGVVSYLLIGFWYKRPTAIYANMKAFLVNRVGDFGFLLGIASVLMFFNSLDYADVFHAAPLYADKTISIGGGQWSLMTITCILLFIGAMGKSAQVPLHVWLPDSMEGPTPISALIHAATMVTAGIFMVARMSPLFELSTTALSFVLVIGSITALFMGLLGIVQNDIKRVVAYSTLSQLGYMTVALGVSAYSAAVFHLMTHAFFKALLFLAAGSVIIGMHHEQDMRKMGGLRKYMPITWITSLIGSLALIGFPGFSGFYSKDSIIEAVKASHIPGSGFAYFAVIVGVFVTAFYSFRMYFLVFHGEERFHHSHAGDSQHAGAEGHGGHVGGHDHQHGHGHSPHESPAVVTVPLIMLAIPSIFIGGMTIASMLFGGYFDGVIYVAPEHDTLAHLAEHFHGAISFALHGILGLPFWLAMAGVWSAWFIYMKRPEYAERIRLKLGPIHQILERKYGFDDFNQMFFADGSRRLGSALWKFGDAGLIDGLLVNGSARTIGWVASVVRHIQSGYLFHYALAMIVGLLGLLTWIVVR